MEKEFEIKGLLLLDNLTSLDQFLDQFLEFVEAKQWSFGGGATYENEGNHVNFEGCVLVEDSLTYNQFLTNLNLFLEKSESRFEYSIREIRDGYYINTDGSKGKYVLDETD